MSKFLIVYQSDNGVLSQSSMKIILQFFIEIVKRSWIKDLDSGINTSQVHDYKEAFL